MAYARFPSVAHAIGSWSLLASQAIKHHENLAKAVEEYLLTRHHNLAVDPVRDPARESNNAELSITLLTTGALDKWESGRTQSRENEATHVPAVLHCGT